MIPGDLCKDRLHNCLLPPSLRECTHVLEIARRESLHLRKGSIEIRCETIDNFRAPAFPFLTIENIAADVPVEQDQFPVYSQGCPELCRLNPALQVREKLSVTVRSDGFHGLDHFPLSIT
jgi:hypothetical protein